MADTSVSVIVFDLGNVLIPFDYEIVKKRLDKVEEGLGDRFIRLYKENYHVHRKYETWQLNEREFLDIVLGWLDNKVDDEEFCDIYSNIFTVNEDVVALLPELKKKYKLVLLSNTNYIHQKYGWEKYPFLKHFDKLILSHEVGAAKPDPRIYQAVEDYTGRKPAEHIFIDDVAEYVEGAKKAGWDGVQFKSYSQLVEDLKARNIIS